MKLFEVEAKCGHVGRKYFTLKVFPVKANSRKEAAAIVRNIPRVKHHHKDAIRRVEKITAERYEQLCSINSNDPYFSCKNIQEHRMKVETCDIYLEAEDNVYEKEPSRKPIYMGKELLRNPKKYFKNYDYKEMRYAI